MGKTGSQHLSISVLVILVLCVFGMAIHYVIESLSPVTHLSRITINFRSTQLHPQRDTCEDDFVFPILYDLNEKTIVFSMVNLKTSRLASLTIPPLVPPPNS